MKYFIFACFSFCLLLLVLSGFKNKKRIKNRKKYNTESAPDNALNIVIKQKNFKPKTIKKRLKFSKIFLNKKFKNNKIFFKNKLNKHPYSFSENSFIFGNSFYGNSYFKSIELILNLKKHNHKLNKFFVKNNAIVYYKNLRGQIVYCKAFLNNSNLNMKISSNKTIKNAYLIVKVKCEQISNYEVGNVRKLYVYDNMIYVNTKLKTKCLLYNNSLTFINSIKTQTNFIMLSTTNMKAQEVNWLKEINSSENILNKVIAAPKQTLFLIDFALKNHRNKGVNKNIKNNNVNLINMHQLTCNSCVLFSRNNSLINNINSANAILKKIDVNLNFVNGNTLKLTPPEIAFVKQNFALKNFKEKNTNCNKLFFNNFKFYPCFFGTIINVKNYNKAFKFINLNYVWGNTKNIAKGSYKNFLYYKNLNTNNYLYFFEKDNNHYVKLSKLAPLEFYKYLQNFKFNINATNKNILNTLFNIKIETEFKNVNNLLNGGLKGGMLNQFIHNYNFKSLYETIFNSNVSSLTQFPINYVISILLKQKSYLKLYKYLLAHVAGIENFISHIKVNPEPICFNPVKIVVGENVIKKYYVSNNLVLEFNGIVYRNIYSLKIS